MTQTLDLSNLSDEDRAALLDQVAEHLKLDDLKSEVATLREEKAELKGRLDQATMHPEPTPEFDLHTETEWGQAYAILKNAADYEAQMNAVGQEEGRAPTTEHAERLQRVQAAYQKWHGEQQEAAAQQKIADAEFATVAADMGLAPDSKDYNIARGAHLAGVSPADIKAHFEAAKQAQVDDADAAAAAADAAAQAQAADLPDRDARTNLPAQPGKPKAMTRAEALADIKAKARERNRPATLAGLFGEGATGSIRSEAG